MAAPNTSAPVVSAPTTPAPSVPTPIASAPVVSVPATAVTTTSAPIVAAPAMAVTTISAPIVSSQWQNNLCSNVCGGDCGTCIGAWACTPFLYGRVAQRLDYFPRNNPYDIQTFDKHCCFFYLSQYVCASRCLTAFKREEMRERLGIEGNLWRDLLVTCFCLECGLAQMNTELKDRSRKEHLVNPIGYQPQTQGMVYLPPNQQPQVQQATPQQPQLSEKKSTPQGV